MAKQLTQKQFTEILLDETIIRPEDIILFQAIYSFEGHKAYASQVAHLLGKKGKSAHAPLNSQIGRLAKRIGQKYDIEFTRRKNLTYRYWDLFFDGWDEGRYFIWQLKPSLIQAMIHASLTGEIQYSEELPLEYSGKFAEGIRRTITVNSYERNPQARNICISHRGTRCSVCDFDFEDKYGEIGKNFIHVHHIIPISQIKNAYNVDPINDLIPVCPNCHAMLHKNPKLLTIGELKEMIAIKTKNAT